MYREFATLWKQLKRVTSSQILLSSSTESYLEHDKKIVSQLVKEGSITKCHKARLELKSKKSNKKNHLCC